MTGDEESMRVGAAGLRVLLAEDEDVNALVATTMLARFGHAVVRTADGPTTLATLRAQHFDLALIDVRMPGMDGLDVMRAFRRDEAPGRRLPMIALTANALEGDADTCIAAGADAYVPKPIDIGALRGAIFRLVRTLPVHDARGFVERMANDVDVAEDVASAYVAEWPSLASTLRAALASGDLAAVERAATAIHDSASVVGGVLASDRARELVRAVRARDSYGVQALGNETCEAGEELVVALAAFAP